LCGLFIGVMFSMPLVIFYDDLTVFGYERPVYVFISGCLGCVIGLLPLSVLIKIKDLQKTQIGLAIAIVIISLIMYFTVVYVIARIFILDEF
jgi:hypothetical protein